MNERLLVALSCGGEFVAALQIEAAILGRGRLPRWAAALLLCLLWVGSQVLWGTYVPYSPWALTFNALRMLAAAFFFGGGLLQKAFSVVVCGVVILGYGNTVGALAAGLNKMPMSEIWRLPQSILLYGVVLNALLYLGIRLLRRWIGAIDPVQKVVGTVYIGLIALLNVILTNFGQDTDQYSYMVLICILLILATLVYFALFTMLSVRSTQASQTEARMKIEQERADALMESYQSQRRLTHEFTNHMGAVGFYLEQGDVEGARAYLASVSKAVAAGTAVVDTHNPLLDAVLSKEYRQAARSGVLLNFDLCDLARFPLQNAELVTLFCNLLDNAIRGAAEADPPQVTLRIKKLDGAFVISVRNRVARDIPLTAGELPASTKAEPGHGMGLANVQSVLERYGGEYVLSCRNRWFCFTGSVPEAG